jgi:5-methylthioribose kinase
MNEMPDYPHLTPETAAAYVAADERLSQILDPSTIVNVAEVGDGNLNLVFILTDADDRGMVLKQALPYLRLVGPSWPLTPERARQEAEVLRVHGRLAPGLVPELYGFDADRYIVAMEYLSGHAVWRTALNRGERHEGVATDLGTLLARVGFGTSVFGMDAGEQKLELARFVNPQLCAITEDLVFTEPYVDAGRNSVLPANEGDAKELAGDADVVREMGWLKWQFMTQGEALVHGDLHTGSVMVRERGAQGARSTKAIDCEFGFYGPLGFDVGALWGNYVMAAARAFALSEDDRAAWCLGLVDATWCGFETEFRRLWDEGLRDPRVFGPRTLEDYMAKVRLDGWGFAAAKAARRIVGLAKVADIETLDERRREGAARGVLRAARTMATSRHRSPGVAAMTERVGGVLVETRTGS